MKYILAGYGNIGKALMSIINERGDDYDITVVDLKDGVDCIEYMYSHKGEFDTLINLTDMPSPVIHKAALDCDVNYIDSTVEGFPPEDTAYDFHKKMLALRPQKKMLFGCGMNPGLIEYLYFKHKPDKDHLAIEFEYDTAKRGEEIFNTLSVVSYYEEAIHDRKYVTTRKAPYVDVTDYFEVKPYISFPVDGETKDFRLIPHEEIFSFTRLNPACLGSCFLYQAPEKLHRLYAEHSRDYTQEQLTDYPVLYDVEGGDSVGMLFYTSGEDNIYYVRNYASHPEYFKRLGTNGTCWQTASGMYTALKLLPLVQDGENLFFSDLCQRFPKEIGTILDDIGFKIDRFDNFVDVKLFEDQLLPIFTDVRRKD